jgi:hypothetical protein
MSIIQHGQVQSIDNSISIRELQFNINPRQAMIQVPVTDLNLEDIGMIGEPFYFKYADFLTSKAFNKDYFKWMQSSGPWEILTANKKKAALTFEKLVKAAVNYKFQLA